MKKDLLGAVDDFNKYCINNNITLYSTFTDRPYQAHVFNTEKRKKFIFTFEFLQQDLKTVTDYILKM